MEVCSAALIAKIFVFVFWSCEKARTGCSLVLTVLLSYVTVAKPIAAPPGITNLTSGESVARKGPVRPSIRD